MAILTVARMGNPILRQMAQDVSPSEIGTPEFEKLIADMLETMKHVGGIGLAAPQVGISKNFAIIEIPEDSDRYDDAEAQGLIVFINPKIKVLDDKKQEYWEGCLSVPGLRGSVRRPRKIQVSFLDRQGNPQVIVVEGFLATVFQHEFDHLRGKLYIDRIEDTRKLMFEEEYDKFVVGDDEDDHPEV